jgi:uncharacterized glyoxalase superfamily protein PhnB
MKPAPQGWPRISSAIFYDEPKAAIDWLCKAFGFEVRLKVEDDEGILQHSELTYGEGLIMVGGTGHWDETNESYRKHQKSPRAIGAVTQAMCIHVDDVDAHYARAKAAGAEIYREPRVDDYGDDYWSDKTYGARDPEGHQWWFMQRLSTSEKS